MNEHLQSFHGCSEGPVGERILGKLEAGHLEEGAWLAWCKGELMAPQGRPGTSL